MKVIAHRGDHTTQPENTLPAFQAAYEAGAYGVELDIRLTADLVPIVFHYFALEGTTGTGFLCDCTYDEIQQFRVLTGETHADHQQDYVIPSLREVLTLFGGKLYLELHIQPASPEAISVVGEMLNIYKSSWDMVEVTSYEPAILLGIQQMCNGINTDLLFPLSEEWMTPEIASRLAVEKGRLANVRAVHLHTSQLTPQTVDFVRSHGLEIHCWDVDSLEVMNYIQSLQIEQFTTDNIHVFLKDHE